MNFNFLPDWITIRTAENLEKEFGPPFKFKGPGWYITQAVKDGKTWQNAIYILPGNTYEFDTKLAPAGVTTYQVFVWNHHEVFEALNAARNAPILVDER